VYDFGEIGRISLVLALGVSLLSSAWIVTLLCRRRVTTSHVLLSVLLFLGTLIAFLYYWTLTYRSVGALFLIPVLRWTCYPLFLFYFQSVIHPKWRFHRKLFFHFIPALLLALAAPWAQTLEPSWNIWAMDRSHYFRWVTAALAGTYLLLAFLVFRRHFQHKKQVMADPDKLQARWLLLLWFWAAALWLAHSGETLLFPNNPHAFLIGHFTMIVGLWLLTLVSLKYSLIIQNDDEDRLYSWPASPLLGEAPQEASVSKTGLSDDEIKSEAQKIQQQLRESREFLKPQFKCSDLAKLVKRPQYQTSEIINRGLGMTFFDLVNSLRVEVARSTLSDPATQNKSIIQVAYEVGYNSKSAFNSAFKRSVGMTPTDFRRSGSLSAAFVDASKE